MRLFFLCFFFALFNVSVFAQFVHKTRISKLDFAFEQDKLNIQFELTDCEPKDKYFIWLEVHDANGDRLKAKTYTGDVGWVEDGGRKQVYWLASKDSIPMERELFVRVFASKLPYSDLPKALLYTAIMPGYGHKALGAKENQLIYGVAGYLAVGSSCLLNVLALSSISHYKTELNTAKSDQYMNDAHRYWNYSLITAGIAAGVWAWDAYSVYKINKKMQKPSVMTMRRDQDFERISAKSPSHSPF